MKKNVCGMLLKLASGWRPNKINVDWKCQRSSYVVNNYLLDKTSNKAALSKHDYLLDKTSPESFPSFSESKHNILCSELKQLYVAITRTRQRLLIYESNPEFSKPMVDYWRSSRLVEVKEIDCSFAKEMQRISSVEEWKSQGIKLFWEKNYEMAVLCFDKAGEDVWSRRAKACGLRARADSLRCLNEEMACKMLREAAEIFDSIARADTAAECFYDLGEYERAGRIYLDKCGDSELRRAGECFTLARLHKIAAQAYADGYFFNECLSACWDGNNFDLAWEYIRNWRLEASRDSKNTARFKGIDKICQRFLEKCARKFYNVRDRASLMKFVRAFRTMESRRHFLTSLGSLDELLDLEQEFGNFIEAAEVAKCLGYVTREVHLLEKANHYVNASKLLLSYVLSNSLWLSGSQGWPLKSFPDKRELLDKALSDARKVSAVFHASVDAEARALSHQMRSLPELVKHYRDAKRYKSRICDILLVRKLLDAHWQLRSSEYEWEQVPTSIIVPSSFEERMLKNKVSVGTLVYVWNLWKAHVLDILECLDSLEMVEYEETASFCFSYFGVRMHHHRLIAKIYVLLNPNAAWLRYVDDAVRSPYRDTVALEACHFVSAARKYWCQELVCCGLQVLESLYECSERKPLAMLCRSMCLASMFDISSYFLTSISSDVKKDYIPKLNHFLQLSATKYFEMAFPLNPSDIISLKLRKTECSTNVFREIIKRNINKGNDKLSYGQIGRTLTIILGSGVVPERELYTRITKMLGENSCWKPFIDKLCQDAGASHELLYHALAETYNANWRYHSDYMSPRCFFSLVERLLILAPRPREGFLFATKSAFAEYLACLPPDADPRAGLAATDKNSRETFDFVSNVVRECVLNYVDSEEWIEATGIGCEGYLFPMLMRRLVVILCLVCLNSDSSFDVVYELRNDARDVWRHLSREFDDICDKDLVGSVARAFRAAGDGLLIVELSRDNDGVESGCPVDADAAIFLDLRSSLVAGEIVETLIAEENG